MESSPEREQLVRMTRMRFGRMAQIWPFHEPSMGSDETRHEGGKIRARICAGSTVTS